MASPKRHLNCKKPNKTGVSKQPPWHSNHYFIYFATQMQLKPILPGIETFTSYSTTTFYFTSNHHVPRHHLLPWSRLLSSKSPSRESAPENAGKSTLKWGPERLLNCRKPNETGAFKRIGPKSSAGEMVGNGSAKARYTCI
jgi:hypothetical protein